LFKPLDPLLHSELRLAIISLLIGNKSVDFKFIKDSTQASSGNISTQLTKLKDSNYIEIVKSFKGNFPLTEVSITDIGLKAFEIYVDSLKDYIDRQI
jgi:predicted transcriptional regulator